MKPDDRAPSASPDLDARAKSVRLLLLDVDGVMTDGAIHVMEGGGEFLSFHVRDGAGIKLAQSAGIEVGILSGRSTEAVRRRADELGITRVALGATDKSQALDGLLAEGALLPLEVAYMGDDLLDLPVFRRVGFTACPADAHPAVLERADYRCAKPGGAGAVREVIDLILAVQGKLAPLERRFWEGT